MFTAKKNRTNGRAPEGEGPSPVKKKLSRADRKQIEAAISRANRTDQKGISAQDSIPYERMWPDGICRVTGCYYTKTIQFQDINYQLSQNEDIVRCGPDHGALHTVEQGLDFAQVTVQI